MKCQVKSLSARRAWIEIDAIAAQAANSSVSLSARRAWIEIYIIKITGTAPRVALRKESVDRNVIYLLTASAFLMSLSARRAWIEM